MAVLLANTSAIFAWAYPARLGGILSQFNKACGTIHSLIPHAESRQMKDNEIARLLSLVLRHEPERIGITLDAAGWVSMVDLIKAAKKTGKKFDREALHRVVEVNDKQRFTLSHDGQRIRAAQGHSLAIDLDLPAVIPPETLWHGTARSNLDSIFVTGLSAGNRQFVHLSSDEDTAKMVGARHGKPVVLKVLARQMMDEEYAFYQADNGVWLTAHVPVQFLSF